MRKPAGPDDLYENIGDALKEPAQSTAESAAKLNAPESKQLANQADVLVRLVDEIQLANMLADDSWKSETVLFSVQDLIDEVVPSVLPAIKRKGLQLLINNHLKAHDMRRGDRDAFTTYFAATDAICRDLNAIGKNHP